VAETARSVWISLAISLAGVVIAAGFFVTPGSLPSTRGNIYVWPIFVALLLLGAAATFFPRRCSRSIVNTEDLDPSRYTSISGVRLIHGHHKLCDRFAGHELTVAGKSICAGCLGLFIGATSSLLLSAVYLMFNPTIPLEVGMLGLAFVTLGLLYIPVLKKLPMGLRTAVNAVFVVGFALTLMVVVGVGNVEMALITIGFFVFWMYTRIQLSQWSHNVICDGCNEPCPARG
jgi:hypothetical protein